MAIHMKNKTMYGYPISSILFRIIGLIILSLIIFYINLSLPSYFIILSFLSILISFYIFIIRFRNNFSSIRKRIIQEMIQQANLTGDEKVLDVGTGSGYASIHFAKELTTGFVIGIDKYDIKNEGFFHWFINELKINFFGNSLINAKENAVIENVEDNISFIKTDLIKSFPFCQNIFNVILSSQFLYCIPQNKLKEVMQEIDRVLSNDGLLVFFESKQFMNWNIQDVKVFFENNGYDVNILSLHFLSNKCIFVARKITL